MTWVEFKDYLTKVTDLHQDGLHIYVSVLIQLIAAVVLRRSVASPLPWLCVLAVELVNEALDFAEPRAPIEEWQIVGGTKDIWNTMLMPTILLLISRFAPSVLVSKKGAGPAESQS